MGSLTRRQRQGQQAVVRALNEIHWSEGDEVYEPMLWISKVGKAQIVQTRLGTISEVLVQVLVYDNPKNKLNAVVKMRARTKLSRPNAEHWIERFSHVESVRFFREGDAEAFMSVYFTETGEIKPPNTPIGYMLWLARD